MSKRQMYETQTEHWITPILERNNFELVDVEYVKEGSAWYLRAYIDKEGGITVDDCEIVAREMNEILDREKDYIRSMGKELEIRTYRSMNGSKEFYGVLTGYDDDTVTIQTEEDEKLTFVKTDIALIRLAFDF